MPSFHNGAVEIAYLDEGEGDPIILIHGFALEVPSLDQHIPCAHPMQATRGFLHGLCIPNVDSR